MPSRIIRESARTSPTLDALSDGAERLFWRLTTVADDFGRFRADPRVVLGDCFPLRIGKMDPDQVYTWISELAAVNLIVIYAVNDRIYGQFATWAKYQYPRAKTSKFPFPTDENICKQMPTDSLVNGVIERGYVTRVKIFRRAAKKKAAPRRLHPPGLKKIFGLKATSKTKNTSNPNTP